jgi:hypothetical protein
MSELQGPIRIEGLEWIAKRDHRSFLQHSANRTHPCAAPILVVGSRHFILTMLNRTD